MKGLRDLILVARGERKAGLLLKNARIINVFSGNIERGNVAIHGDKIAGIGEYEAEVEVDLKDKYVSPGFIDGHVHIESSMVRPEEFALAVVRRGTTAVIADPHEIANVSGVAGIEYFIEATQNLPISVFFMLSSCVPATSLESSGACLSAQELGLFLGRPEILGLAEMMNFPGVLSLEESVVQKLEMFQSLLIDGHAPGLSGKDLAAYIAAGISSDHESTELDEAKEKLERGMWIALREGSTAKDLRKLLPLVNDYTASRCFFATDDRDPENILEEGHIDFLIRTAIQEGLDPVRALQLATLNPANYFQLRRSGAIAPGFWADLAIFEDLQELKIDSVIKRGRFVVKEGEFIGQISKKMSPTKIRESFNLREVEPAHFKILARGKRCRVIKIIPNEVATKGIILSPRIEEGEIKADIDNDLIKVAVLERHHNTGNIGLGLVQGFGLKSGALASSVAHDSHNIVVVGVNDDDMALAVNELRKMNGGLVVAQDAKILASLPLPIAGLMSEEPLSVVVRLKIDSLGPATKSLRSKIENPFLPLSFISLAVIPELKITDLGLVDVSRAKLVDLFVE